jgi:crotonobetaine/carnitine-CoA ligase
MAVIAAVPGESIDCAALIAFLEPRMSYFMIPRYIRILDELPKTASAKVQKAELRVAGITIDTWDRDEAGIKLKREKL